MHFASHFASRPKKIVVPQLRFLRPHSPWCSELSLNVNKTRWILRHKTIACFSRTIWNWHDPARFVEQVQMKFNYGTVRSKYQSFAGMIFHLNRTQVKLSHKLKNTSSLSVFIYNTTPLAIPRQTKTNQISDVRGLDFLVYSNRDSKQYTKCLVTTDKLAEALTTIKVKEFIYTIPCWKKAF